MPTVSVPLSWKPAPTYSTAPIATTPRNSIAGKKNAKRFWAWTFATRFASFSSSNSRWNARSRLKAWMTAMPETDSASCAVTAAIRVRTSPNATWLTRWNQRVTSSPGGKTTSATSPSRQSSRKRPASAAISVSVLTTSVVSPCESTSERASTSLVRRAMIQPAFCFEKYRSESDVR